MLSFGVILVSLYQNCALPPGIAPVTPETTHLTSVDQNSPTSRVNFYLYFAAGTPPENADIQSIDVKVTAADLSSPIQQSWSTGASAAPPLYSMTATVPKGSARLVEAHVTALDPVSRQPVVFYASARVDIPYSTFLMGLNLAPQ